MSVEEFADHLHRFFYALPRGPRCAVELRNKNYLAPVYFDALRAHNVPHVLNSWTRMPSIGEQLHQHDPLPPQARCGAKSPRGTAADPRRALRETFAKFKESLPLHSITQLGQSSYALPVKQFTLLRSFRHELLASASVALLAA